MHEIERGLGRLPVAQPEMLFQVNGVVEASVAIRAYIRLCFPVRKRNISFITPIN